MAPSNVVFEEVIILSKTLISRPHAWVLEIKHLKAHNFLIINKLVKTFNCGDKYSTSDVSNPDLVYNEGIHLPIKPIL